MDSPKEDVAVDQPKIEITAPTPVSPSSDKQVVATGMDEKASGQIPFSDEKIVYEPPTEAAAPAARKETRDEKEVDTSVAPPYEEGSSSLDEKTIKQSNKDAFPEVVKQPQTLPEAVEDASSSPQAVSPLSDGYLPSQSMTATEVTSGVRTVTPLRLLKDQPDTVDCPFCQRQVTTVVKQSASGYTHLWGSLCCVSTLFCAPLPYIMKWSNNFDHFCSNCNARVARLKPLNKGVDVAGTPDHLREPSKYPAAEPTQAPAEP